MKLKGNQRMKLRLTTVLSFVVSLFVLLIGKAFAHESSAGVGLLHPKGLVAVQQRVLLLDSVALMLSVVIPVIVMSVYFAWRYRAKKKSNAPHHHYEPDLKENMLLEAIWWGVPAIIVSILGILLWTSAHRLDPYKPLDVPGKPLHVEVIALRWKWLFIYPEQKIATLNFLELPVNRQVEFWITADAPMSSFVIPQLGGQIYAMAGMRTKLHLYPTEIGTYPGLNMQFNGKGFSDMKFDTKIVSNQAFNQWIKAGKRSTIRLNKTYYEKLTQPSIKDAPAIYGSVNQGLFQQVIQKYMQPPKTTSNHHG